MTEDLLWCGHLDQYDDSFDKLSTKNAKPLQRIENKVFYYVSTSDDSVLQNYAVAEAGNVFATDAILALLMASPRSVYSWDIVIQKFNGVIYMDKRENSTFDFLTVSETAHEAPVANDDTEEINHPEVQFNSRFLSLTHFYLVNSFSSALSSCSMVVVYFFEGVNREK